MNYTTIPQHVTTNAETPRCSSAVAAKKNALCSKVANGWHPNGKGSRQWTGTELDGPRTRNHVHVRTYTPDILRRVTSQSVQRLSVSVFFLIHPRWLAGFFSSKQPDFEICFPWCLTQQLALGGQLIHLQYLTQLRRQNSTEKNKKTRCSIR